MRKIFKENALNEKISADGYVLIPQFLNPEELNEIREAYRRLKPDDGLKKTFSSYEGEDLANRRAINQAIRKVIARSVNELYVDYKPLTGVFISKPAKNDKSKIKIHFDSNCIEEEEHESTVLWVPLFDVNKMNGGLQVFTGSHHFMSKIRPFGAPFCYRKYYDVFEREYMTPLDLRAGDALIFFNRILHYSDINRSDADRVSFRIDMIPSEVSAIQYFWEKGMPRHKVKLFKIDDAFYERFTMDQPPGKEFLAGLKADNFVELPRRKLFNRIRQIQHNEMQDEVPETGNKWIQFIKNLFNR